MRMWSRTRTQWRCWAGCSPGTTSATSTSTTRSAAATPVAWTAPEPGQWLLLVDREAVADVGVEVGADRIGGGQSLVFRERHTFIDIGGADFPEASHKLLTQLAIIQGFERRSFQTRHAP